MLNKISDYLSDNTFRLTLYEDRIHIINYHKIISLEDNYVSLYYNDKKLSITGTNLSLKKLLDNEMLIIGNISKVEVIHD